MSKQLFKEFFKHTLRWEGGDKLHKVSGDSGGWTLYGIAYNKNKHLFESLDDFKSMDYERASEIAYNKYYLPIKTELLPEESQLFYFDMAYNMGNSRAIRYLQNCIGVNPDGIIGDITKANIHKVQLDCLYEKRNNWYKNLKFNTNWGAKFYKGWMNRSKDIYEKSKLYKRDEEQNNTNTSDITDSINNNKLDNNTEKEPENIQGAATEQSSNSKKRFTPPFIKWFLSKISR